MTVEPGAGPRWPARSVSTEAAEAAYRVRFDEAGPDGVARPSTLLRYAQDVAWIHSESLGFDRAWYATRGLAWVVRSAQLATLAPVRTGNLVVARTQVVGFRKIWARRRTEVRSLDGDAPSELLAWLHTDWVMTDERGAPARVPPEIPAVFGMPPGPYTPLRVELPDPPDRAVHHRLTVRPRDIDPMGHANNAVYLDWAAEAAALVLEDAGPAVVTRARLEYLTPAAPGDALVAAAWELPGDGNDPHAGREIAVRIRRADGADILRAAIGG
ncbi:MAG TPA: acyl-ACP thioesterase domain-containing protein [Candidatus Limnocylindrales bacterium]|nr:acyl-ACP thioesterase domain-containing protein [Candidatus Limnocylindrales bacterium]